MLANAARPTPTLTWSDALQSACELEALNSGYSGGYAGVSIWSYALPDWQTIGLSGNMACSTPTEPGGGLLLRFKTGFRQRCRSFPRICRSIWTACSMGSRTKVGRPSTISIPPRFIPAAIPSASRPDNGRRFGCIMTPFNTAPYASLSFWINGGAAGASGVQVMGVVNNQLSRRLYNLPALAANTWAQFNIPLSALGVANIRNCQGFWFYATSAGTTTFYVDSIQLNIAAAAIPWPWCQPKPNPVRLCCNCPVFPASPIGLKPRPIWQTGSPSRPMP